MFRFKEKTRRGLGLVSFIICTEAQACSSTRLLAGTKQQMKAIPGY